MTGRAKALPAAALAIGAALVLAGCNGDSTEGKPTAATTSAPKTTAAATTSTAPEAAVWDPCTIPDSALTALGLNTSTKENTVAGVDPTGWKVCSWQSEPKAYTFSVLSSEHTLEESRQRTDYVDYMPTTVGAHQALQFRGAGATHDLGCWLAVEVPAGIVDFHVLNRYGSSGAKAGEPCAETRRLTEALAMYLPAR
ncbi:DUF3558 domain-containing protein [Nocardia sp. NBC_00565]|uniref:DUF3558 domain-containing protein n=1 Tax=Nocardia sp. NBC_00565 TaxID=2975993 RepID=UPI002E80D0B7|nr:DUF3558 domain-containing protein [Nocardia sp. NBC_00565]WUC02172.1 DUF3558 domain-containing protein [Nocardia sp. NBC_00565]